MRLSVPVIPVNHIPTLLCPSFGYIVETTHSQTNAMQSMYHMSSSFALVSSYARLLPVGAMQISAFVRVTSDANKYYQPKFGQSSFEEHAISEELQYDNFLNFEERFCDESHLESERRRKIGLANKGKVPWNKGRKHSAETRALIKQKTIEALKDPKVKKKMSECPRAHSDQSKSRISSSLRRVWGKRLNFPRIKEKFYLTWAATIASAAKLGGNDQRPLDWESYDKLKEEIARQNLELAGDREKGKEMAKVRAERVAQAKADKMAKLAVIEKEKANGEETTRGKKSRKSREERAQTVNAQELKLKERLTKILKKKSINISKQGEAINLKVPVLETLDLDFVKREKLRKEVSLADQIRAAKNKRAMASLCLFRLDQHKA